MTTSRAEIEAVIDGLVMEKRVLLSNMRNPQRERDEIARMREQAAKYVAEADRRETALDGMRERYIALDDRVLELRQELLTEKHGGRIDSVENTIAKLIASGVDVAALLSASSEKEDAA